MKKNTVKLIVFLVVMSIILVFAIMIINDNANKIPTNYIAVFHGGEGKETYSTYIYKGTSNSEDYGFKYINTTNETSTYGSKNYNYKITRRGNVDWRDQLFSVAKENNAYDYVTYKGKDYSIEDFIKIFIPNTNNEE